MNKIKKALNNPWLIIYHIFRIFSFCIPDKLYLSLKFRTYFGYWIDWKNPKSYNETLQYLKVFNRNPIYSVMVDKYAVKQYVSNLIGNEYIIPTLAVYRSIDDINLDLLPNQFVLKTTHCGGGNGVVICKDKRTFDFDNAKNRLKRSLNTDLYREHREWPYKNVVKQIIAEELLLPEDGDLKDYKVMCFNGKPKLIEYHSGRFTDSHTQDFYNTKWERTHISQGGYGAMAKEPVSKPACLEKMLSLCEKLAKDMPHVRVDWYYCNGCLLFGELTLFDGSGFEPFDCFEDDLLLGSWIDLSLAYSNRNNTL